MNFDLQAFQQGAILFLAYFGMAAAALVLFKFLYQLATPYNEMRLIREGSTCAGVTLGGAMIGFSIPVARAVAQATSPLEFIVWALLAAVIQVLAFIIIRALVIKDLGPRIERGELSVAIYLAATSIAVGMLNAASMTE